MKWNPWVATQPNPSTTGFINALLKKYIKTKKVSAKKKFLSVARSNCALKILIGLILRTKWLKAANMNMSVILLSYKFERVERVRK